MKKMLTFISVLLLTMCPVLAEESAPQAEANAAYAAVLLDGAAYLPMQPGERTLQDCEPVRFTVLDMDGDGMAEIVLEVTQPEGFIILMYHKGAVYGGEVVYRGLLDLKDDGTYSYSSGAADNGVAHMSFAKTTDDVVPVGIVSHIDAGMFTAEDGSVQYILGGGSEATDEAGYLAFLAEQDSKLPALWYDYTEENVKLLLGL